jgi:methanogenic corrinoid protein MtbC1
MVEGFFRAAGWSVAQCGADDSISALRKQPYAIFGVSVSCRRYAESLRLAIQTARQESKNTSILILVGGDLVNQDPALVQAVGADGTAADARCAVATAEKLASRPYYT